MLFFKKKKEEKMPSLGKGFVPTDRVKELSKKGFSEPEIIDVLRKEGFSAEEIDKGLTQALKVSVTEAKPEGKVPTFPPKPEGEARPALPTLEEVKPAKPEAPAVPETTLPEEYYYEAYPTEEYVDYLVKERMKEIDQRIKEFSSRYNELERKIAEIHSKLSLLTKEEKPASQELLLTKMDAFKETVDDVSVRLSSLERAFKETLPALIESVRALSDLVQRLKREA